MHNESIARCKHHMQTLQWPEEKIQKDRQYNGQKKKDKRTDNTMAKRKKDKRTDNTTTKRKKDKQYNGQKKKDRQYNDQKKKDKRTDNTMAGRKKTKGQTIQ